MTNNYINNIPLNRLINAPAPNINTSEQTLPRGTRRTLAQLRANKSPILLAYLHNIDPDSNPSPLCNREEFTIGQY